MSKRLVFLVSFLITISGIAMSYNKGQYEIGDYWNVVEDIPKQAYTSFQGDFKSAYNTQDRIWYYKYIPYEETDISKAQALPKKRPYADQPMGANGWWVKPDYPMGRVGLFSQKDHLYIRPLDGQDIVLAWCCPQSGNYKLDAFYWTEWDHSKYQFLHSIYIYQDQELIYADKGRTKNYKCKVTGVITIEKGSYVYLRFSANNRSYAEQMGNLILTLTDKTPEALSKEG